MSDKPTQLPEWATNDTSTEITEPSGADKLTGWVPDEQPAAQHMNWLQHRIYLWSKWLSEGIFQRSSLTDNTPVLQTCDRDARPRHYLGPEGYWMGNARQIDYIFYPIADTVALTTGDPCSTGGLQQIQGTNTEAYVRSGGASGALAACSPVMVLRVLNAATTQNVRVIPDTGGSSQNVVDNLDDTVVVLEATVSLDTVGSSGVDVGVGLREIDMGGGPVALSKVYAMFSRATGSANWDCNVCNGAASTTVVGSGVAAAAGVFIHLRIELHGANTPVGVDNTTAPVARFFINGAEVAEITTTNVPDTDAIGPWIGAQADGTGPTADVDFECSRLKIAWSDTLDFDVPA